MIQSEDVVTFPLANAAAEIAEHHDDDGTVLVLTTPGAAGVFAGRLLPETWLVYVDASTTDGNVLRTGNPDLFDAGMIARLSYHRGIAVFAITPGALSRAGLHANTDGVARFRLDGPSLDADALLLAVDAVDAPTAYALRAVIEGSRR